MKTIIVFIVALALAGCGGGQSAGNTPSSTASNNQTGSTPIAATSGFPVQVPVDTGTTKDKTIAIVQKPVLGIARVLQDSSTIDYVPDPDKSGEDTFSYSVGGGVETKVTMKIVAAAVAPIMVQMSYLKRNSNSAYFDILGRPVIPHVPAYIDIEGGVHQEVAGDQISIIQQPTHGTVTLPSTSVVNTIFGPTPTVTNRYMIYGVGTAWDSYKLPTRVDTFAVLVNGVRKDFTVTVIPPNDAIPPTPPASDPPPPVYNAF